MNNFDAYPEKLEKFAYLQDFPNKLEYLKQLAQKEIWYYPQPSEFDSDNKDNPVLHNYIKYTYSYIANKQSDKIKAFDRYACFNTGLFTPNYDPIFALFEHNRNFGRREGAQKWFLSGFFKESDSQLQPLLPLPARARYFNETSQVVYDTTKELYVDWDHILDDAENLKRIPEDIRQADIGLKELLQGALNIAKKRVQADYRTAVPQCYQGEIQFLLPLFLRKTQEKADLALAIKRDERSGHYIGKTCLTINMAYNNARLLTKPYSDWLKTTKPLFANEP